MAFSFLDSWYRTKIYSIWYIGQSKHFEEWYKNIKSDQSTIYKDFEEKSTFTKHAFKESDYDSVSIWKYDWIGAIDKKIQEAEKKKKDFDDHDHIKELHKELENIQQEDEQVKKLLKKLDLL